MSARFDSRLPASAPSTMYGRFPQESMADSVAEASAQRKLFMDQKKELAELRNRLASVLQGIPSEMRKCAVYSAVVEDAQALLDGDIDAGHADGDIGVYEDVLDAQIRKCEPPLDIVQHRLDRHYLPSLTAEDQRKWKLLFSNPTTSAQKADVFASSKRIDASDRMMARRRLENERCVSTNQVLQTSINSINQRGDTLVHELMERKTVSNDSKLNTEQMQCRTERVYKALNILDVDEDGKNDLFQLCSDESDQEDMRNDSVARFRSLLRRHVVENENLRRTLDQSKVRTALYSVNLKAMAVEMKDCWGTGKCVFEPPHSSYFDPLMKNLERVKELVNFKPNPSVHCADLSDPYEPLGMYSQEMVQQMMDLSEKGRKGDNICASSDEWSSEFVGTLSLEFSKVCLRSMLMAGLMNDLEDLNRCPTEKAAFSTLTLIIEKTVQCHIARLFFPMKNGGGGYWAMVHGSQNIVHYLSTQRNIVSETFRTGTIQNVGDIYTLEGFDKAEDMKTGYRTKAVMCVPIRTVPDGPVIAVIQVINKVTPAASYFNDFEAFLLHVIGSAYLQVTFEIQDRLKLAHLSARKDILVSVAEELFQKGDMQHKDLLTCLHDRLTQLFSITNWALLLVGETRLERMKMGFRYAEVAASASLGKGLAGMCVAKKELCHYHSVQDQRRSLTTAYGNARPHRVDIETTGRLTLWPIVDNGQVISIIEFSQSPEDTFAETDQRGFDPNDPEHVAILEKFFAMFQYFIEKFWPRADRFGRGKGDPPSKKGATKVFSSLVSRNSNLDFQGFGVFARLIARGGEEDWVDQVTGYAATKIQRKFRQIMNKRARQGEKIPCEPEPN